MKTAKLFLSLSLMFFFCESLHAQVTIGGLENPKAGAILDLNSTSKGGLVLSNVTITNPEEIPQEANVFAGVVSVDVNMDLRGIMVYNDGQGTSVPAGIYIWNGNCWTKDGGNTVPLTPPSITVNGKTDLVVILNENDPVTFAIVSPQPDTNYTWYKNDNPSTSGGGEVGSGISFSTTVQEEMAYYYCVASSAFCPLTNHATSSVFTVMKNSVLPLVASNATFTGRSRFDIVYTEGNSANVCGTIAIRSNQRTDFAKREIQDGATASSTPFSGVQTYTLTSSGGVSRVRFGYREETGSEGFVIDSIVPELPDYATADGITVAKVVVYYKTTLNTKLQGLTRDQALKAKLFALYNPYATYDSALPDQISELGLSLQDCHCCGAYVAPGQWLNFMCHNLGANETYDPFTPAAPIYGAKYKFGANEYTISMSDDQNIPGTISTWSSKPYQSTGSLWSSDPCPAGWKVTDYATWNSVISAGNNPVRIWVGDWTYSSTNYTSGLQIGDALFLPASGYRSYTTGGLNGRGAYGSYWSSSGNGTNGYYMELGKETAGMLHNFRTWGFAVRCVAN